MSGGVLESNEGSNSEPNYINYAKGDYLTCGADGERHCIGALDFSVRYERARPEPAATPELKTEGYLQFYPTGKIWAYAVSEDGVTTNFPAGQFVAIGVHRHRLKRAIFL